MSNRVPFQGFVGSAYGAQSKRLDTQDLWNWYVERAGSPYAKAPQALLPCPGFQTFTTLPTAPVRGLFAQNDRTFAVSGDTFYELSPTGTYVARLPTTIGTPNAPVVTLPPLTAPLEPPPVPVVTHGGTLGTTTYGYSVTAVNDLGETQGSGEGSSNLGNAALSGTNWNIISWSAVEKCTGYKVYRTAGGSVPPRLIATLKSTTLVFNDIGYIGAVQAPPTVNTTGGAAGATTYGYKITATLGINETAASTQGVTTTGPVKLSSTAYVIVTWGPVENATGYKVYRTVGGASPPRLIATVLGHDTITIHDTGEEGEPASPPTTNLTGAVKIANDLLPVTFCSSGDAGNQLFFVSGGTGYCYDLKTNVLAPVVQGASAGGFIDSYFVVLDANTSELKVSESFDGFTWDPTQVYQRSRAGDKWLAMAVTSNMIWLIGTQTGEVWTGTGAPDSRFTPYNPVFLETGVIASASMIRVSGDTMMWVAQDKDGAGFVVRTSGYTPEKVSTIAVDHAMQALASIADGYAFSYQQEGHTFYVLTFPSDQQTWVFDLTTNEWHRRGFWDPSTITFLAYRPQCHAFAFGALGIGMNLVGDRMSGIIAKMRQEYGRDVGGPLVRGERPLGVIDGVNHSFNTLYTYTNLAIYLDGQRLAPSTYFTLPGNTTFSLITAPAVGQVLTVDYSDDSTGSVIRRVRQGPHISNKDEELTFDRLQMDMDTGEGLSIGQGFDPTMMLVYSNDAGNTWGYELWRSAGKLGDHRIQVAWSRLGTAKNRVFRLVVSDPVPWRLVGAWLEIEGS
jgi:hypothetical protein